MAFRALKVLGTFEKRAPENSSGFPLITVEERKGQQTAIKKHNIHVAFFSGMPVVGPCLISNVYPSSELHHNFLPYFNGLNIVLLRCSQMLNPH